MMENVDQVIESGEKIELLVDKNRSLDCQLPLEVRKVFSKYDQIWSEFYTSHMLALKIDLAAALSSGKKSLDSIKEVKRTEVLPISTSKRPTFNGQAKRGKPKERSNTYLTHEVAIIYDDGMMGHEPPPGTEIEEVPERLSHIKDKLKKEGLWDRCSVFYCNEADETSLLAVHEPDHVCLVGKFSPDGIEPTDKDMYHSKGTTKAALLAAGGVIKAAELVVEQKVKSAFAIVRPPGHHVGRSGPPCGFCFLNNISVAAAHLLNKYEMRKILIVDWDVHHGDGTQDIFYKDERVLFFSVHRADKYCYPMYAKRTLGSIGEGKGVGFNVNVCWSHRKIRDVDYIAVWDHILLPMAGKFKPEIILISASFDAAKGDKLGKCEVTPNGFATLLHKLMAIAPVVMVLEGGYNLSATSNSAAACIKVMLGDKIETLRDRSAPYDTTRSLIVKTRGALKPFWKVFAKDIPNDVLPKCISVPKHLLGPG